MLGRVDDGALGLQGFEHIIELVGECQAAGDREIIELAFVAHIVGERGGDFLGLAVEVGLISNKAASLWANRVALAWIRNVAMLTDSLSCGLRIAARDRDCGPDALVRAHGSARLFAHANATG